MYKLLAPKAYNLLSFIKKNGGRRAILELTSRIDNYYHEIRFGVDTYGRTTMEEIGIFNKELVDYMPLGYYPIFSALKRIPIAKPQTVFLDYGCGKGRAVVVGASMPYKRVVGIEISEQLFSIAKTNIEKMKFKKASHVDLYNMDATEYLITEDVNLIYFFNPFKGSVLQKVISNIKDSYERYPREIYIIYFYNDHFEKEIYTSDWIVKIWQRHFYPDCLCGIYVTKKPIHKFERS